MKHKPSIEDILELSGIDILHPGGFEITKRIGEIVDMTGKKVLDVACGRGTLPCYYAREFRARITGIDLNPEMIESAVKKAASEGVE
ncbi:MAG: class I SAM-dependent methyltransferase, partial [bacterium]